MRMAKSTAIITTKSTAIITTKSTPISTPKMMRNNSNWPAIYTAMKKICHFAKKMKTVTACITACMISYKQRKTAFANH
jgi:hypothetical protein